MPLQQEMLITEESTCLRKGRRWEISVLFPRVFYEPKSALKKQSLKTSHSQFTHAHIHTPNSNLVLLIRLGNKLTQCILQVQVQGSMSLLPQFHVVNMASSKLSFYLKLQFKCKTQFYLFIFLFVQKSFKHLNLLFTIGNNSFI